jgi:hypothetical protein
LYCSFRSALIRDRYSPDVDIGKWRNDTLNPRCNIVIPPKRLGHVLME